MRRAQVCCRSSSTKEKEPTATSAGEAVRKAKQQKLGAPRSESQTCLNTTLENNRHCFRGT